MSVELCAPSRVCDRGEVGSDSSRKMQDKEASGTAVTKGREKRDVEAGTRG